MPANTPEEVNDLFVQYMREGNLEAVLSLYEDEVAFAGPTGEVTIGKDGLREELSSFTANKQVFRFDVKRVIRAGDVALIHNQYQAVDPPGPSGHALEVARRQSDGTWRWLIGDPFSVGQFTSTA